MVGVHSYTYDKLNRLLGATHPIGPTESYSYDEAGNRLTAFGNPSLWIYDRAQALARQASLTIRNPELRVKPRIPF